MCGGSKETTNVVSSGTQQATPTAEETQYNQMALQQYKDVQPQQTEYYNSAYALANSLMKGSSLPGYLNSVVGGISKDDAATQATSYAINAMPGMQSMGILDSGVAAKSIAKGIANEVTLPVAEYNSNLLLNLLNLATGQSSSGTNQFASGTNTLATQLAGLRSTTTTGNSTSTLTGMNPFLKSFQQGLGTNLGGTLGGGNISKGSGWFGI